MKVLAFNGSPHHNGTTAAAIAEMTNVLIQHGITVETIHVGSQVKGGCIACGACLKDPRHHCSIDDVLNTCIDAAKAADGLIFGTPVYYGGIAGNMKSFMDRFFHAYSSQLQYKVGTCLAVARRAGTVETVLHMNSYLLLANMLIVPSRYWSGVFGAVAKDTQADAEGRQHMRTVGTNMAWLMKSLDAARDTVPLPVLEDRVRTNFI